MFCLKPRKLLLFQNYFKRLVLRILCFEIHTFFIFVIDHYVRDQNFKSKNESKRYLNRILVRNFIVSIDHKKLKF